MSAVFALQRALGLPGFYLALLALVLALMIAVRVLRRRGSRAVAALLAWSALALTVAAALDFTLSPLQEPGSAPPRLILDPLQGVLGWGDNIAWRPVANNVGLFVPLGASALAAWRNRTALLVWWACVLLSVGIETTQLLMASGRVANIADVIANAVGAALGIMVAGPVLRVGGVDGPRRHRRAPEARRA